MPRPHQSIPPRRSHPGTGPCGFTLIELLVVIAILLVISAIAVENLHTMQTRARVTSAQTNLRELTGALEAYHVDWNSYPLPGAPTVEDPFGIFATSMLVPLTTPLAYTAPTAFNDPFGVIRAAGVVGILPKDLDPPTPVNPDRSLFYYYYPWFSQLAGDAAMDRRGYCVASVGPDTADSLVVYFPFPASLGSAGAPFGINHVLDTVYDPTNGSLSRGDLAAFGGLPGVPARLGGYQ